MRKITTILSLVAIAFAWVAADCSASPLERERGKNGVQNRSGKADRQQRGAGRDPAQRVQRMIEQFDTDGDQKLDAAELQEFLSAANQRRGQGASSQRGGKRAGKGGPGGKGGKGEGRKGKKRPGEGTDFQGATPNLPPAE